jgi:hypothetical protein
MSNPRDQMDGSSWKHPEQSTWTQQSLASYMPVLTDDEAEQTYLPTLDPSTAGMVPYDFMTQQPDPGYQYDGQAHENSGGLQDPSGVQSQTISGYTDTMSFGLPSTMYDQSQLLNHYWETGDQSQQTRNWGPDFSGHDAAFTVNPVDFVSTPSGDMELNNPVAQDFGYSPINSGCQPETSGGADRQEHSTFHDKRMAVNGKISKPARPCGRPYSGATPKRSKRHRNTDDHLAGLLANSHDAKQNAKQYKVWREDGAEFPDERGNPVLSMRVPTQKALAARLNCNADTIRRAVKGRKGKAAIIKREWVVEELDVWNIDMEQSIEDQAETEQQPDQQSLVTGSSFSYTGQHEYEFDFNFDQPGMNLTGFNPASILMDSGSGWDYGQPLPMLNEASRGSPSVGSEYHEFTGPSDTPRLETNGMSELSQHDTPQSKFINRSTRFLVKRKDGKSFKYNGKDLESVKVQGTSQVGYICNCSHNKVQEAVAHIKPDLPVSLEAKDVVWKIEFLGT